MLAASEASVDIHKSGLSSRHRDAVHRRIAQLVEHLTVVVH